MKINPRKRCKLH